jgi:PIN domain nuclease of toxin-antitoxin system
MISLDTHVAAWLHAGELALIPSQVQDRLEREPLGISPMVLLELQYLKEIGRIMADAANILTDLEREIGLVLLEDPFSEVVRKSLAQTWTRDPFDRMLAAHALLGGYPLATRDAKVLAHCPLAFWG